MGRHDRRYYLFDDAVRCPHCKRHRCYAAGAGKYRCHYCQKEWGGKGSGVLAPLTYRQQLMRDQLAHSPIAATRPTPAKKRA